MKHSLGEWNEAEHEALIEYNNRNMKKVTIKNYSHAEVSAPKETFGFLKIPLAEKIRAEGENLEVSDGYHTFDELYEHRIALWIRVCAILPFVLKPWRSKKHSDGELAFGGEWFVLGIGKEAGKQITYHLPIEQWDETDFAETLEVAPEYDGHSSADVLERLKNL